MKKLPALPPAYVPTKAGQLYSSLHSRITKTEVDSMFNWSDDLEQKLKDVATRLLTSDPNKAAQSKTQNRTELDDIITILNQAITSTSIENYTTVKELKSIAEAKRKIATEAVQVLADSSIVKGIGSDSWKALWNAAKNFSVNEAYKELTYPHIESDARCVLCQQILDKDAQKRLLNLNDYIEGVLETEASSAESLYEQSIAKLPAELNQDTIKTKFIAAGLDEDWASQFLGVYNCILANVAIIKSGIAQLNDISEQTSICVSALNEKQRRYDAEIIGFNEDAKSFDRATIEKEKVELEALKYCFRSCFNLYE